LPLIDDSRWFIVHLRKQFQGDQMSGFRAKSSAFIQVKVLELMRNCIGNHSGPVANNYFFLPIASLMTQIETQRMVKHEADADAGTRTACMGSDTGERVASAHGKL